MDTMNVDLKNCYGIRQLQTAFDFSQSSAYALYAPNGSMKSSFARTLKDISDGVDSKDRIYTDRVTDRRITDENGTDIPGNSIFVVEPYNGEYAHSESTSTLLIDNKLRTQYEDLLKDIDRSEKLFLKAIKQQSGSKKEIKQEIARAFTGRDDDDSFYTALGRIRREIEKQKDAPWSDIKYDVLFDDKVRDLLSSPDVKKTIDEYVRRYNELIAKSQYFKKGIFNYYNAATIAKNLAANGFFKASHLVRLKGEVDPFV